MKRAGFGIAMSLALVLSAPTPGLGAEASTGGSYNDSTSYNSVVYAVKWTSNVKSTYTTDYQGNKYIQNQAQGGCYNNYGLYGQSVSGHVTYYWPGGSRGPIYSTSVNPVTTMCQSGSGFWGNGRTYNDPSVIFLVYDAPGTDYVRNFSQWYCGSCYPWYLQRTEWWYWN